MEIGLSRLESAGKNAGAIEITARQILRFRRILVDLFVSHTGQAEATIFEDMDHGTRLSPEDAIIYGLVDQVIDSLEERSSSQPTI